MMHLINAELAKLFSTRLWLWLLLGSMAITALYASLNIAFNDDPGNNVAPPLSSPGGQQLLLAISASAPKTLVAVLAAVAITGEFRHRTVTATFLATPHRSRVVMAKLVTYALIGVMYAAVCIAVVVAIGVPWLDAKGIDIILKGNAIAASIAGTLIAVMLFALIGVGLGTLLRNQAATVVGMLVYLFVAEPIVTRIPALSAWSVYLPGAATNALTQVTLSDQSFLPAWHGGVVLAGYAVVLAVAGIIVIKRHNIT